MLRFFALSLVTTVLVSCGSVPPPAAGGSGSKVDEFSRRVQIAIQEGKLESKVIQMRLPDGRTRVITASGWKDE